MTFLLRILQTQNSLNSSVILICNTIRSTRDIFKLISDARSVIIKSHLDTNSKDTDIADAFISFYKDNPNISVTEFEYEYGDFDLHGIYCIREDMFWHDGYRVYESESDYYAQFDEDTCPTLRETEVEDLDAYVSSAYLKELTEIFSTTGSIKCSKGRVFEEVLEMCDEYGDEGVY